MNWDIAKGNWKQFRGTVQESWGKLTDDDVDQVEGSRERLVGKVQEKYGYTREKAEDEVAKWEARQS